MDHLGNRRSHPRSHRLDDSADRHRNSARGLRGGLLAQHRSRSSRIAAMADGFARDHSTRHCRCLFHGSFDHSAWPVARASRTPPEESSVCRKRACTCSGRAGSMSPFFVALKLVHIVSATVLFGTGLGTAFQMWAADRTCDARVIAAVAANVVRADLYFTTPAIIVQPLTGLSLLYSEGIDPFASWL